MTPTNHSPSYWGHWHHGTLHPLEENSVSQIESAYYGYSAFTSFLWPLEPRWLEAHLQRVVQHATLLGLIPPTEAIDVLQKSLIQWLNLHESPILRVRITALPIVQGLSSLMNQSIPTQWIIQATPYTPPEQSKPLQLGLVRYTKALPHLKHGSLLEPLYYRRLAQKQGLDDVLWVNDRNEITEATTANVFFEAAHGGALQWVTPPATQCLAGIGRQQVIEEAFAKGKPVIERLILVEEIGTTLLKGFLTNAIKGIQPFDCDKHLPWVTLPG